jgi:hypothetical protein
MPQRNDLSLLKSTARQKAVGGWGGSTALRLIPTNKDPVDIRRLIRHRRDRFRVTSHSASLSRWHAFRRYRRPRS